jgi:hypothetical protein
MWTLVNKGNERTLIMILYRSAMRQVVPGRGRAAKIVASNTQQPVLHLIPIYSLPRKSNIRVLVFMDLGVLTDFFCNNLKLAQN